MRIRYTLFLLFTVTFCFSQNTRDINLHIDNYIADVMSEVGIPGVALAIIKEGEVIHKNNYGYASIEHQVPISDNSIFRIYSLTKLMVSVGIFQLIESDSLDLEDEISEYVDGLPLDWQSIKIKHLLSHSSGLPDMSPIPDFQDLNEEDAKQKVFSKPLKFELGEEYDYNQTGFWLLQKVIEKLTKQDLSKWITNNQFPAAEKDMFFSSDSRDIVLDRVTAYFPFVKGEMTIDHPYLQGTYAHAMNGGNITLEEFVKWNNALIDNELISKKLKELMWKPFPYLKTDKTFTYGWDHRIVNDRNSYGFSGSLITAYRIFPEEDIGIIFLSNGLQEFYNIEHVINQLAVFVFED